MSNQSQAKRIKYESICNGKRQDLARLVEEHGYSLKDAAELLKINYSSARSIMRKYNQEDLLLRLPKGGCQKRVLTQSVVDEIDEIISSNPQFTLNEIKTSLITSRGDGFTISISSIDNCLKNLKITLKQVHRELDIVNAPDKLIARKEYSLWFNIYFQNDYSKVIFVDESSFNLHLRRSQGRSIKGSRANIVIPTVRGKSISIIWSISINQICLFKPITHRTVNAEIFSSYLLELCTYIKNEMHLENACIILDNARVHKKNDICEITSQFGFQFKFLSAYSYMLNPMENAFSKLKNDVRSRLRQNDSSTLSDIIMKEVRNISPNDCAGYFRYISRNITNCAAEIPYVHK